ncbi:MAG: hypothetical protein U9R31_04095 [Candidatus Omnitrophota bacterium]|nr:hypothetical protein [Candidatus Omnitrophota bacterium]
MRRGNFIWIIAGLICAMIFSGCGEKTGKEKVAARVNDYVMTVGDLENEIKYFPGVHSDKKKNLEKILDLVVRKQVLIQEAQRQGLDREETFMKTIERYWRQTLIKELLEKKTRQIVSQGVSENERTKALANWVETLYKKANIKIYKDVLEEIGSE